MATAVNISPSEPMLKLVDPLTVGLAILRAFTDYSNTLPRAQAEASMRQRSGHSLF
jgi:hypothetical protein